MRKCLILFVVFLSFLLGGCGSILMRPAVDDVKTVALASVYMNREFYNIKSPKSTEGNAAFASLLEAAGKVVADNVLKEAKEHEFDDYDPERMQVVSYGVQSYLNELNDFDRWQMIPLDQVVNNETYKALKQQSSTDQNLLSQFFTAYASEREKVRWVVPPGFNYIPISSVIKDDNTRHFGDYQDPTEAGRKAMAALCQALGVDAVVLLQLDMGYRFNKLAKISLFGTTLAVPSVSASLVVVNKNGEVAVNTGPIIKGGGDRYEGDTVGMVKGDVLVLKHKEGKAVQTYNVTLEKAAAGLRERLEKAFSKI